MVASTKGRLTCLFINKGSGGVSQTSENDVWSERYKRCRGTEAQVLWRGDTAWQMYLDLCAGNTTGIEGRKPFSWSSRVTQSSTGFMCVNDRQWWNRVQQNSKPRDGEWASYRGDLCSMRLWLWWFGYAFCFSPIFPNLFCIMYHACNCFLLLFLSCHV